MGLVVRPTDLPIEGNVFMSCLWRTCPLVILLLAGLSTARGGEIWQEQLPPGEEAPADQPMVEHEPGDVVSLAEELKKQEQKMGCGGCGGCPGGMKPEEEYTIGIERVPFAPLFLESAYTFGKRDVFRLRIDGCYDWENPDRLEYLWAQPSKGPPNGERSVDFQDLKIVMIRSGPKFQIGTEMSFRSIDPQFNADSVGLGDMKISTKTVVKEGTNYHAAHFFETTLPTGYTTRGMGSGHVSMENDLLYSYRVNSRTYLHAQVGYWFGIAASPPVAGQMWHYGFGVTKVLWDHPIQDRALIAMLEFEGWTITDGGEHVLQADNTTTIVNPLDPESIYNFYPGLRYIINEKATVALGGGLSASKAHWFEQMFRFEFRWMY